uniref:Uncharacterized protein n=1 Tax=Onchocerca volvulus TaxID=6282 RepID=A0A8R1XLS5_ONCVO
MKVSFSTKHMLSTTCQRIIASFSNIRVRKVKEIEDNFDHQLKIRTHHHDGQEEKEEGHLVDHNSDNDDDDDDDDDDNDDNAENNKL